MTSARKIKANRENAKRSSGPRTQQGKARSAQNAYRHGLCKPIELDPYFSEQVRLFARQIVGDECDDSIFQMACKVAEAQIDLNRVRAARREVIAANLSLGEGGRVEVSNVWVRAAKEKEAVFSPRVFRMLKLTPAIKVSRTYFRSMLVSLKTLDRYERRALSRRKAAIRALDLARRRARTIQNMAA